MIKLWLDDLRDPKTFDLANHNTFGRASRVLSHEGRGDWTWVKTVPEAKAILLTENVSVLSCDNDLGTGFEEGWTLLNWLEEMAATLPDFKVPERIYVHTDNMDRVGPMQQTVESIKRFRKK